MAETLEQPKLVSASSVNERWELQRINQTLSGVFERMKTVKAEKGDFDVALIRIDELEVIEVSINGNLGYLLEGIEQGMPVTIRWKGKHPMQHKDGERLVHRYVVGLPEDFVVAREEKRQAAKK